MQRFGRKRPLFQQQQQQQQGLLVLIPQLLQRLLLLLWLLVLAQQARMSHLEQLLGGQQGCLALLLPLLPTTCGAFGGVTR
jgi:hypothetical protein